MKKTALIVAAALCLTGCLALVLAGVVLNAYATRPAQSVAADQVVVITRGETFRGIASELEKAGIIKKAGWFVLIARLLEKDGDVRAGEYRLSATMTPKAVLDALVEGKALLHRLTVPEGLTLKDVARLVEQGGFAGSEAFLAVAGNPETARKYGIPGPTMEGYLFPDTYFFLRNPGPQKVVDTMAGRFFQVFDQAWEARAADMGMTVNQAVTLASIIEKETGAAKEYGIISSVFHNRLKRHMRLQSDPTVIYGIEGFDGNLTRKHLETDTPYNTYVRYGLPPGPIANPGKAALLAALYPDKTQYLYFVSRKDGTHEFSETLRQHNRAVSKYQLGRR